MSHPPVLTQHQRDRLGELEPLLAIAANNRNFEKSKEITAKLQNLLRPTGHETRLLQSKNRLYEVAMEVGKIDYAIRGFVGVRQKSAKTTRLYLEATALLTICYLRKSDLDTARPYMVEALKCEKNIKSDSRRSDFKVALATRFDQEALLASIVPDDLETLDVDTIQENAIKLVQTKSDDELFEMLGGNVPPGAQEFLERVNQESRNLLSYEEKLRLPSPASFQQRKKLGKGLLSAFQSVIWKSLCDSNSDVYKMWFTNGIQGVMDKKYLTGSVVATLTGLKVGVYAIAVYLTALLVKIGIEVFCKMYQPTDLMDLRK